MYSFPNTFLPTCTSVKGALTDARLVRENDLSQLLISGKKYVARDGREGGKGLQGRGGWKGEGVVEE